MVIRTIGVQQSGEFLILTSSKSKMIFNDRWLKGSVKVLWINVLISSGHNLFKQPCAKCKRTIIGVFNKEKALVVTFLSSFSIMSKLKNSTANWWTSARCPGPIS